MLQATSRNPNSSVGYMATPPATKNSNMLPSPASVARHWMLTGAKEPVGGKGSREGKKSPSCQAAPWLPR
ncbi:hypothetical protein KH5H1_72970 [Corallococcus caeni]|nr:hypothetical protein KH5H1_72970 [Corallococcus sp. KH5-1]